MPARVLLQDFTGVPCVVDLAAMRDGIVALGGRAEQVNPLQPVELVIAGSPPEKKLPPNVKYLGFVREVEELYAAADVAVHPAGYEPYGQIISESILCGTPVLISHMVGAKDVVSAREGLVVQGFDVAEWAAAVMKMATGEFDIPADFAGRHGLRLEDHMARILAIAEKTNV